MKQRVPLFLILLLGAVALGFIDSLFETQNLLEWTVTLFVITTLYVFPVIAEHLSLKASDNERTHYQMRKTISLIF